MSFPRIAVVGAGLAGLACARLLPPTTVVFEKSRVLGGRCATKQWGSSFVDHGVQCFTMTSPVVQEVLWPLLSDELRSLPDDSIICTTEVGHSHGPMQRSNMYYCSSGNSAIGKALAKGVKVVHEAKVTKICPSGQVFYELGSDGDGNGRYCEEFDLVICTAPIPQVCEMLGREVEGSSFVPNVTALLHYDLTKLGECGLIQKSITESCPYAYISETEYGALWSGCENAKKGREVVKGGVIIVVQGSDRFSQKFIDRPSEEWVGILREQAEERWKIPSKGLVDWFGKRWKYAKVDKRRELNTGNVMQVSERVVVCGDGVSGVSDVENSLLQGIGAAKRARELIKV